MNESADWTHDRNPARFSIREAQQKDHDVIAEINRRAWAGGITTHELLEKRHGPIDGRPWAEHVVDAVTAHVDQSDVTTFVAEDGGRVVGYAAAQIRRGEPLPDVGVVSYNAVDPEYRGRGIGTALTRHVVDYLKEQGARVLAVWTLEADEPARRLYERLGFQELARFVYYSME